MAIESFSGIYREIAGGNGLSYFCSMLSWFGKRSSGMPASWKTLQSEEDWKALLAESYKKPQMVFKHSTRCSVSTMARYRLQDLESLTDTVDAWYLDLLAFRQISNTIATDTGVPHESPQVILLVKGRPVYIATHNSIDPAEIIHAAQ